MAVFITSALFRNKLNMDEILNATMAGGVIIGTSSGIIMNPAGAITIGIFGGVISTLFYIKIAKFL